MEVEDVTGIGLAARRTAQQQRHLAIRPGMLGQVVVDAQGVLHEALAGDLDAVLHDLLAHRDTAVRGEILERGGLIRTGHDDDRVVHGAVLLEDRDGVRDRGELLADRHVDADEALALLVDDRVDGDGGLARLAVADDQLALAAADRDQGIDGLDARLDGRVDRLADDDARGDPFDGSRLGGFDRSLVVERLAERVHDATEQPLADGHVDDAARGLDRVAFLDRGGVAEQDRADRLFLEVEGDAHHPVGELEQLGRQGAVEPIDLGDAVPDLDDGPDITGLDARLERIDGGLDDAGDLVGTDGHGSQIS